jgi:hypothetical protein
VRAIKEVWFVRAIKEVWFGRAVKDDVTVVKLICPNTADITRVGAG